MEPFPLDKFVSQVSVIAAWFFPPFPNSIYLYLYRDGKRVATFMENRI